MTIIALPFPGAETMADLSSMSAFALFHTLMDMFTYESPHLSSTRQIPWLWTLIVQTRWQRLAGSLNKFPCFPVSVPVPVPVPVPVSVPVSVPAFPCFPVAL